MLGFLLLAVPLFAPGASAQDGEPPAHGAIDVDGDTELLVPDAVSGNGVRGGSGTPDDPWRISGWWIGASYGAPAIAIRHVVGHVLLEDLVIETMDHDAGRALVLERVENVTIRNVLVTGEGALGEFRRATVAMENVRVEADNGGRHNCLYAEFSDLRVVNFTVEGLCGSYVLTLPGTSFDGRHVRFHQVGNGIRAGGPASAFILRDASITATDLRAPGWTATGVLGYEGIAVDLYEEPPGRTWGDGRPPAYERVVVEDSYIGGFERRGCAGISADGQTSASIRIRNVTFDGCGTGLTLDRLGAASLEVSDLRFVRNRVGLHAYATTATADRMLFSGNDVAATATGSDLERMGPGDLTLRNVTFTENEVDARGGPWGRVRVVDGWWASDCNALGTGCDDRFEGNVTVETRARAPPVPLVETSNQRLEAPFAHALTVVAGFLAGRLRGRRRTTPPHHRGRGRNP